ncbi:glycosyltransferase family 2 protein [candidate division CSSED10-310 bacterium]|uniref:Glycosyltransferase family 2 protein n=1 Tax=candidate division CSSED10-310 bacterium TaxID=2855610 RepID=A0ABV6Z094_UNCC1
MAHQHHNNHPLFSVIIPTYNRAHVLPRVLQSILNQTLIDFELIIVDDGSNDDTAKVIRNFCDDRIHYVKQDNQGVSEARNNGVIHSTAPYLTFIDSDDEALPEWLSSFARALNDKTTGIVCCGINVVSQSEEKLEVVYLPKEMGFLFEYQKGLFLAGSFALRRELFDKVGGYAAGLSYSENTELAFRLIPYCLQDGLRIVTIQKALVIYHKQSVSTPLGARKSKMFLYSAEYILHHHHQKLNHDPPNFAVFCGIAGVNAIRLRQYGRGISYFLTAIRKEPSNWKHYFRLGLSLFPPLGRLFWLRSNPKTWMGE